MVKILPIIVCGGSGSRLWPISNSTKPKQFINLFNGKSLFDLTLERSFQISNEMPIIIASRIHKKHIAVSIKKYDKKIYIIWEEEGRNTAAAITFGLKLAHEINNEAFVVIMPSDHYIKKNELLKNKFHKMVLAKDEYDWFLFGVKPSYPATGYGYINSKGTKKIKKVLNFIEKPNKKLALSLIKTKNIFWNSGIFAGMTSKMLMSIQKHAPDIYYKSIEAWKKRKKINKFEMILKKEYISNIRSESIDKAVLETDVSKGLSVFNFDWSDVGSWDSLSKLNTRYLKDNIQHVEYNSSNNSIFTDNKKVYLLGVNNLIVVSHKNKILILEKGKSEKVKYLIDKE